MQADAPIKKDPVTDLTIYGATSFVARHVLTYLVQVRVMQFAQSSPAATSPSNGLKLTLAGRNTEKLKSLQTEWTHKMKLLSEATGLDESVESCIAWDICTAEADDMDALRRLAARTKVVLSCAGPFAKYGSNLVAACAELGTHYVDITGEMSWVGDMRARYDERAKKSGAKIVPLCGCDCIPSDLAVYATVQVLREKKPKIEVETATTYISALGIANGGTLQTMKEYPVDWLKCFRQPVPFLLEDPLVLCDPAVRQDETVETAQLRKRWASTEWINQFPMFHSFLKGGFSGPFLMAVVNAKCVYASSLALSYGQNFRYYERYFPVGFRMTLQLQTMSLVSVILTQLSLLLGMLLLRLPLIGPLVLRIMGGPGTGASDALCSGGHMEVYVEVRGPVNPRTGKVDKANGFLKFKGDPGNWVTAQCVTEAALCLLYEPLPKYAGFGTPAQVMGDALLQRLCQSPVRKAEWVTDVRLKTAQTEWKMFP